MSSTLNSSFATFNNSKVSFDDSATQFGYEHEDIVEGFTIGSNRETQARVGHDTQPLRPIRRSTVQESHFHYRPSIWLFGSDDTAQAFTGWAGTIAHAYSQRADVFNRGYDGYNTLHALHVFPRIFGKTEQTVLYVTVWFGVHDASLGSRHVSLTEYIDNINCILKKFRILQRSSFPILLLTPAPVNEAAPCFVKLSDSYSNDRAREYGEALKEVATLDENCAVVDVWECLDGDSTERALYLQENGIHLNEKGHVRVADAILSTVQRIFPYAYPMEYNDDGEPILRAGVDREQSTWKDLVR
ncbi:hypothetical protein FisN_9Hh008 [Fistulifera solaris]|uniref:SGNH hydrolase-type esterase domain-containing protein n=1 Tax=Fistulifera solaris TaxID=1519565 RepID=A0A1Z5K1Y7_FISSO|nr:hypothetical protein FisN_9Hh008 [Fistulifera solaris]|eukprot:GAX20303.1 hypothetical protein FisN_9Hh008 [Fistulifera solaris]